MKIYLSTFVFMLICWSQTWAQLSDTVYAQIGKIQIGKNVFERNYQEVKNDAGKLIRCQLISKMIQDSILLLEAKASKLEVSQDKIDDLVNWFAHHLDSLKYIKVKKAIRIYVENKLLIQNMHQKIEEEVKISPIEVKKYFQKLIQKPKDSLPIFSDVVEVGQICMYSKNNSLLDKDSTYLKLQKIRNSVIENKLSFTQAFRKFSENKSESVDKNGFLLVENERFISLDQINSYVYFTIDTMQVGQISLPTIYRDEYNRYGFQLIYLKSKTKGGVPDIHNPAHYLKIKAWALAEKQEIEFKKWVQRKVKKYQVKLASEFQNCVNY